MNPRNFVIIITVLVWLNSCHKQCHGVALTALRLSHYDSVTDKTVKIIKCVSGTGFAERIDSSVNPITAEITLGTSSGSLGYNFADDSKDYLVVIQPSGVTHKITNITHGNEKESSGCGGGSKMICAYGYTVDGQPYTHGAYQEDGNGGEHSGIIIP